MRRALVALTLLLKMSRFSFEAGATEAFRPAPDSSIVDLLRNEVVRHDLLPPYFDEIIAVFFKNAPRFFDGPFQKVPVREILKTEFAVRLDGSTAHRKRHDFGMLLARLNLPSDLMPSELALFEENPKHWLFARLNSVPMPKRWTAYTIDKAYQMRFVIDAVRAIKNRSPITQRGGFDQFRKSLENFLGQSIDSFNLDLVGHLDLSATLAALDVFSPTSSPGVQERRLNSSAARVVSRDVDPIALSVSYDAMVMMVGARYGSFQKLTVREMISHEFARIMQQVPDGDLIPFKRLLAAAGLPTDLSDHELRIFEANPSDPLFARIDAVKLPPRFGLHSLAKSYGVLFVIDAVRELGPGGRLSARSGAEDLRKAIADFVGRPFAALNLDSSGHLIEADATSPNGSIMVLVPGFECAIALENLPTDIMKRELRRRKRLGID